MLVKKRICLLLLIFAIFGFSSECLSKEEKKTCFQCHTAFSQADYNSSVHGQFTCTVCHKGLKLEEHVKERRPKKDEWRKTLNRECLVCHDLKILSEKPNHRSVLNQLLCSECHDPHLSKPLRTVRKSIEERDYCLKCHGKKGLKMRFKNGELISLYVDEKEFLKSAHGKKPCTFCHEEFSKGRHPRKLYESKRDFVKELSPKACARCHADECRRYERCVHGASVKKKGIAPLCSDCHRPHYVRIEKHDMELHLLKCVECHKDVYDAYKESVHFKAFERGNKNAPLCTGCHKPHDVLITSFNLKNNEVCFECHKKVEKAHVKWFYNPPFRSSSFVKFHLESITCNVCHGTEKKGAVYLHPYDKRTRTPITLEKIEETLGVKRENIGIYLDADRDGYLSANETWRLFGSLIDRKITLTLLGWMDVRDPVLSHLTEPKEKALRNCEVCHRADSPFFKDAFVVIRDNYGWPMVFRAHKDLLSTKSALSPLSEFYVFGSTRLKIVDLLLVIAIIGAILVPSSHILLRIVTRKWRREGARHER